MVRGRLSCNEDAAIALLKLVKQSEAEICCVAGTDAYQIRRNAWQRVADELNACFQLEIPPMRWKKKFRNIQASAKHKINKNLERIINHEPFLPLTAVEEEFSRSFNYARRMRRNRLKAAPENPQPLPAVDMKPDLYHPQSITEGTGENGAGSQLHSNLRLFEPLGDFVSNGGGFPHQQQPCSSTAIVQQSVPITIPLPINGFADGEMSLEGGMELECEDEKSLRKLKREVLEAVTDQSNAEFQLKRRDLIEKHRRRVEERDENRRIVDLLEDIKKHLMGTNGVRV